MTNTHTVRWHAHHHTEGTGHLYQGRFRRFRRGRRPLVDGASIVERNPLREPLRTGGAMEMEQHLATCQFPTVDTALDFLTAWPIDRPRQWLAYVNKPQTEQDTSGHSSQRQTRHALRERGVGGSVRGTPSVVPYASSKRTPAKTRVTICSKSAAA